tara:strand:+ start:1054 stop:1737 length:684 start_codon:yes stop_codon:yes gene_type:complete
MISVDNVYQRVLAIANKEQRGYITPQEFNLIAPLAQMEIFEQYFYDENQADRNLKNSTQFSNSDEMIDEKISIFKRVGPIPVSLGVGTLPTGLYRLGIVFRTNSEIEFEQLTEEEMLYVRKSPLTKPTAKFPAYYRESATTIKIYPNIAVVSCNYIQKPSRPNWNYVVVNEKALYNATGSVGFQIHDSDESELVYKILSLAGITIAKPGLSTIVEQQVVSQKQQEKQ